jgi:EamA domain-containing membrane protein RarD
LLVVSFLNGFAGLVCGVLFVAGPDGSLMRAGTLIPLVRSLPLASIFFRDFTWIGVAMLLTLGIPNAFATVMLIRRSRKQYLATLVAGVLLLMWTGFELVFMYNVPALGYFVVGVLSVLCSVLLLREGVDASAEQALPAGGGRPESC